MRTAIRACVAAGLSTAATVILMSVPAHGVMARPEPTLAMTACRQGVGGSTVQVHLSPRSLGEPVGLPGTPLQTQIADGAVVRVTATGRISYGGVFNWRGTWGPAGNGRTAPPDWWWPYPSGPDAALVGTWNQTGGPQRIGADSGCVFVPRAVGPRPYGLWLKANDDWTDDNGDNGYAITVKAWLYHG